MNKKYIIGLIGGALVIPLLILVIIQHTPGQVSVNKIVRPSNPTQFDTMPPETLVQLWEQATRTERIAIVESLLRQRPTSLPVLRNTVQTGSQEQKLLACSLLAEMKDNDAIKHLLLVLGDVDEKVRVCAVSSLGELGDVRAIDPLRKLLQDNSLSKTLIKVIIVSLGRLGSREDISTLQSYLSNPDESVRVNAAVALAMLGDNEGEKVLLQSSRSSDPMVQKEATYSLGYLNTTESRNRLLEIIDNPQGSWKSYARIALAHQDLSNKTPGESVEYLSNIVQKNENERLTEWAIERLGEIDTPQAKTLLISLSLKEGDVAHKALLELIKKGLK